MREMGKVPFLTPLYNLLTCGWLKKVMDTLLHRFPVILRITTQHIESCCSLPHCSLCKSDFWAGWVYSILCWSSLMPPTYHYHNYCCWRWDSVPVLVRLLFSLKKKKLFSSFSAGLVETTLTPFTVILLATIVVVWKCFNSTAHTLFQSHVLTFWTPLIAQL